jgi:2'-5' RNA ligase
MRLFVAIEIPSEIREKILDFISALKPRTQGARWVQPDGLHVTLKFLGNVADEKRGVIEGALRTIKSPSFTLSLHNTGVFPTPKYPRVLWIGIDSGPELAALAAQADEVLSPLGFEREKRAFTPHVTLARLNERGKKLDVRAALSERNVSFGTMTAMEFHLYESKLSPQGARYAKLTSFALT